MTFKPILALSAANKVSWTEFQNEYYLNAFFNQIQLIHTTTVRKDIDSAAKYIGAGAATVGVAGAGNSLIF